MNCTSLVLTPKLREAMWRAGKLISFELPDLALVKIPIEIQRIVQRFPEFDRTLDQFWSDYKKATLLASGSLIENPKGGSSNVNQCLHRSRRLSHLGRGCRSILVSVKSYYVAHLAARV
jgi:hypothetical protein